VLAWLSVWSEVLTCIWPSWCHYHSLSLASLKSRLVLPFWYRLTRVVPDKGPLNSMCVCVKCWLETAFHREINFMFVIVTQMPMWMSWCSDAGRDSIWLIAPLIAKLSSIVQGRILKHAGQVLETGNNFWTAKNTKERERCLQKRHFLLLCIDLVTSHMV